MKQIYIFLFLLFSFLNINAQIINFPDVNFKNKLLTSNLYSGIAQDINGNNITIDINADGEIEVSEAQLVYRLNVAFDDDIIDLTGISYFSNLQKLNCERNSITFLDLTSLQNLEEIICDDNAISNINVTGLNNLTYLSCGENMLSNLDVSYLQNLNTLICYDNQLSSINLDGLINLQILGVPTNQLTSISTSDLINLKELYVNDNLLTNLDLSYCSQLEEVNAGANSLNSINLNGLNNLRGLGIYGNLLTNLDLSSLSSLEILQCFNNNLTQLDFSNNPNITELLIGENFIPEVNIANLIYLEKFSSLRGNLTTLDISKNINLFDIDVSNNQLQSLFMKNGVYNSFPLVGNLDLEFVCVDNGQELLNVQTRIDNMGLHSSCVVNTYCSFIPGGDVFFTNGYIRSDYINNGCDPDDTPAGFNQFEINDGIESWILSANAHGFYSSAVLEGAYTIVPILENPTYFAVSPELITLNFPADPSPFLQDFCIIPNGEHPDLEIEIIPLNIARPGFDSHYKLIYHNKGNQMQSGEIKFRFYPVTQFVSSIPDISSQDAENLYYDYVDLKPFETREINLIMSVNGPMDNPPINIDDFLGYKATIYPLVDDETPNDNKFELKQRVVGSLDPNDKACLQGESVGPETAGQYVHYLIRFENTGNYPAENIVVKDEIDTDKFDVSTLRALNSSHEFYSRIRENVVEFIFENINLPFDDQNNDGYVLFKIKTKPQLQLGDTFSNEAAIYFDYNFPVITNEYITTIEEQLGTTDFDFGNKFVLYPNPSKKILNIQKKGSAEITSVEIYNLLGQVVIAIPSKTEMIDVSSLNAGSYFVKINTNEGSAYSKFIKE